MPIQHNLTDLHRECCDRILQLEPGAIDYARALEECGVPCDEQKEAIKGTADFARNVKRRFFTYSP